MPTLQTYQLLIKKHERLLGHFESSAPWSKEAVEEIASQLRDVEGYQLEALIAVDERRIVESGPSGIKILAREYIFNPVALDGVPPSETPGVQSRRNG